MRYDPTIRVITTFFAALVGFGLKHLLDIMSDEQHLLSPYWKECFLISLFLFLRFITGSANHLNIEHNSAEEKCPWLFFFDVSFLIIFGILASFISYAENLTEFLSLSSTFATVALFWAIIINLVSYFEIRQGLDKWSFGWMILNLIHAAVFYCAWYSLPKMSHPRERLWYLISIGIVIFLADFVLQIFVIEQVNDKRGQPVAETKGGNS